MLQNIRVVLVETSHPGNIGATARAMMTMGLQNLYLVNPLHFPHAEATARASGATGVLEQAHIVPDLEEALADCTLVIGTSARIRHLAWPLLQPREAGTKLWEAAQLGANVAIVFGREHSGLTNEELHRCNYHIQIPTNPHFSSLNIAAAVQILCYEIRLASDVSQQIKETYQTITDSQLYEPDKVDNHNISELATHQDLERFYAHLQQVLEEIEFLDPKNPRQLMSRLRRLFTRAKVDMVELNILRGILTAIQKQSL